VLYFILKLILRRIQPYKKILALKFYNKKSKFLEKIQIPLFQKPQSNIQSLLISAFQPIHTSSSKTPQNSTSHPALSTIFQQHKKLGYRTPAAFNFNQL
jgi:hypothetical protein